MAHETSASPSSVLVVLPASDAKALAAMLVEYDVIERELRHARETHGRRGDDASEERVLDLECEHKCQAERLARLVVRTMTDKLPIASKAS